MAKGDFLVLFGLFLSFTLLQVQVVFSSNSAATASTMERRGKLLVSSNVPPVDAELFDAIRPYQNSRRAVFCGFQDDNTCNDQRHCGMYILTRFAEPSQVQPMGMREQLTFCKEPVKECYPASSTMRRALMTIQQPQEEDSNDANQNRDGHIFVFGQDTGGDENTCYYMYHSGGKTTKLKLHNDEDGKQNKIMHRSWAWNNNRGYAAFVSNARDGTHFDLYLVSVGDIATFVLKKAAGHDDAIATTLLYENDKPGYLRIKDFDGNHLLVEHYTSVTDSRLYLFSLSADDMKKVENITEIGGGATPASVGGSAQILGRDNKEICILYSSDRGDGEYKNIRCWEKSNPKSEKFSFQPTKKKRHLGMFQVLLMIMIFVTW